jgi:hypothetical protein
MSDFTSLAQKHKMQLTEMPVTHSDVVNKMPSAYKGGVCMGLTTVWLSCYGTSRVDPMAEAYDAALKDSSKLFIVRQIQQMESSRSDTFGIVLAKGATNSEHQKMWEGVGFGNSLQSNLSALGCKKVEIKSMDHTGFANTDEFPFATLARYCATHEGLHLIKFPSHYCGAIIDNDRFFFSFIDVNYGQVYSSNAHAFQLFLTDYFASGTVKGYGAATTGVAHAVTSW